MTAPTWPASLPQSFSAPSFEEEGTDNLLRSEPSIGPAKTRRRTTASVRPMSGQMLMTAAQLRTLEAFIRDDIADRAKAFLFPDQRCGGDVLVRIRTPIKTGRVGGKFDVSLSLEILP